MEPGLYASHVFEAPAMTYPYGCHAAIVEVDVETARVKILKYVLAYDIGKAVNPMIVDGQLVGAMAQGIGSSGAGAALAKAVADALAPLGVPITALPLSPDRLHRLITERRS